MCTRIGTTHAEDVEKLVNRDNEQGLPPYLLWEIDLVVFPRRVDGDRYVGEVVELLTQSEFEELDSANARYGVVEKDDATVYWNTVAWRDTEGQFHVAYDHPQLCDDREERRLRFFDRLGNRTDRTVEAVEDEFHRKHQYVQYLEQEGMDDFTELFAFLSDLQTNEAATVERAKREDA